jgi:cytochrome b6-f complex iron-sulfur subunit
MKRVESEQSEREKNPGLPPGFPATRRVILKGLLGFVGAIGLGSLFYGVYRFLAPNAGASAPVEFSLSDLSPGGTYPFQYGSSPGLLFRGEEGTVKAFSLVCTHLACTVSWNPEKKNFYCPCHEGLFDAEGRVVSGPPPAPLERFKVEVKGNKVVIGVA